MSQSATVAESKSVYHFQPENWDSEALANEALVKRGFTASITLP
jgi:hypothetical protein